MFFFFGGGGGGKRVFAPQSGHAMACPTCETRPVRRVPHTRQSTLDHSGVAAVVIASLDRACLADSADGPVTRAAPMLDAAIFAFTSPGATVMVAPHFAHGPLRPTIVGGTSYSAPQTEQVTWINVGFVAAIEVRALRHEFRKQICACLPTQFR